MSGLSDADRLLVLHTYFEGAPSMDEMGASLIAAVEAIVTRAINKALTEAADAIEGRNEMYEPVGGAAEASRYAAIVRARTT